MSQFVEKKTIRVTVNRRVYEREIAARTLLADFLRDDLGLTATRLGCEHGVCGACTILLDGVSARSCLMFAIQADGAELTTVEGLADGDRMHPLQQAFRDHHALQCGFCTSGFLMTGIDILSSAAVTGEDDVRHALSGNLCRCTGYANIVDAVMSQVKQKP